MEPEAMILVFGILSFNPAFHSPLSPSSRGSYFNRTPDSTSLWGLRVRGQWLKQLHSKEKRGAKDLNKALTKVTPGRNHSTLSVRTQVWEVIVDSCGYLKDV